MKKFLRYAAGYIIGITFFILIVPFALYKLSVFFDSVIKIKLINSLSLQIIFSVPFFIAGFLLQASSNMALFTIGKGGQADAFGISVSPRTQKLVIIGPYRYVRNPMVLGTFVVYFGLSILLDSLLCFIAVIVLFSLAVLYLKLFEEKQLVKVFGDEFVEYQTRVPMIFPFIKPGNKA